MESSDMKNMVVLKNLPSNMVEEAIIIFKENQGVKETEFIEKGRRTNSIEIQTKSKDCILKEAEMLVTDYINKIENKNENNLVARNENGLFIENETNSVVINIKFKQSDSIFRGEKISKNGITNFVKLYSVAKFRCTNLEYHKNSKYIKCIYFEEI